MRLENHCMKLLVVLRAALSFVSTVSVGGLASYILTLIQPCRIRVFVFVVFIVILGLFVQSDVPRGSEQQQRLNMR